MPAYGLYHAVLYVRDLAESLRFYRDLVGFTVLPEPEAFAGRAAALIGSDHRTHHELLLIEVGDAPGPMTGRRLGLYHLGIKVGESKAELRDVLARLEAVGAPIVGSSDHTVTWSLYVLDPDGNEIELYADNPAIDWKTNPEAAMAPIRPLNLAD